MRIVASSHRDEQIPSFDRSTAVCHAPWVLLAFSSPAPSGISPFDDVVMCYRGICVVCSCERDCGSGYFHTGSETPHMCSGGPGFQIHFAVKCAGCSRPNTPCRVAIGALFVKVNIGSWTVFEHRAAIPVGMWACSTPQRRFLFAPAARHSQALVHCGAALVTDILSIASFVTQRESEVDRRGYVPQCANASSCCTGKQFRLWFGVPTVRNCLSSGQDCKLNDSSVCILRNLERPSERIEKRRVKVITIQPVQVHHPHKQQPIHNCLNCYQRQQLSLSFIGESKNRPACPRKLIATTSALRVAHT
jgi:hypothetical protein